MICQSCNKENPADAQFCIGCGKHLISKKKEWYKIIYIIFSSIVILLAIAIVWILLPSSQKEDIISSRYIDLQFPFRMQTNFSCTKDPEGNYHNANPINIITINKDRIDIFTPATRKATHLTLDSPFYKVNDSIYQAEAYNNGSTLLVKLVINKKVVTLGLTFSSGEIFIFASNKLLTKVGPSDSVDSITLSPKPVDTGKVLSQPLLNIPDEYHFSLAQLTAVEKVLRGKSGWRVARTNDCTDSLLFVYQKEVEKGYLPYFNCADFNGDGNEDFALGFIHNSEMTVLYFLSTLNGYSSPRELLTDTEYAECALFSGDKFIEYGFLYSDNVGVFTWDSAKTKLVLKQVPQE